MKKKLKVALRVFGLIFIGFNFLLAIVIGLVFFNRHKIIEYSKDFLREKIHAGIKADDINISLFDKPGFVSVIAKNSSFAGTDSIHQMDALPIFKARQISLHFNLWKLLVFVPRLESVSIRDAKIQLLRYTSGETNFSFIGEKQMETPKENKSRNISVSVNQIDLRNVFFSFKDSLNDKSFEINCIHTKISLSQTDSLLGVVLKGNIYFGGLSFNTKKGAFVGNAKTLANIHCTFNTKASKLAILPSSVTIEGSKYGLDGYFIFGKPPEIHLQISADEAYTSRVLPNLPRNVSSKIENYQLNGPIKASLLLSGKILPGQDPFIDLNFSSKDNTLNYPGIYATLTGLSFSGSLTNHVNKNLGNGDANSMLKISGIKGNIGDRGYINTDLVITGFVNARADIKTSFRIGLADYGAAFPEIPFSNYKGNVEVNAIFSGRVPKDTLDIDGLDWHYSGIINLENAGFKYKEVPFEHISGKLEIANNLAVIDGLDVGLAGNKINISGEIFHPLKHFIYPSTVLKADLTIRAGLLDAEKLLPKQTIHHNKRNKQSTNGFYKAKQALENIDFSVGLNIEKIKYRKLTVNDLYGNIVYTANRLKMEKLVMKTGGGVLSVTGSVNGLENREKNLMAVVKISDVDVQKLFYAFENFNQDLLTDKNVGGRIYADVVFKSPLTNGYAIQAAKMNGTLNVTLKDGKLLNFEPFLGLSRFIFKKRHLEEVSFSEIKSEISLNGKEMTIKKIKLHSTAFTLFLDGRYNFNKEMDLHIQIPLSNLRNREKFLQELKKNPDMETGSSLRLHAHTKKGKFKLGYDFGRFFERHKEKRISEIDSTNN